MTAPPGSFPWILTMAFSSGDDRNKALGIWGAISGLAAAAGVFLGGMLLVYALVRAPEQGWGSARTIGGPATAGAVLAACTAIGPRRRHPLFSFSVFRLKGLAAAPVHGTYPRDLLPGLVVMAIGNRLTRPHH